MESSGNPPAVDPTEAKRTRGRGRGGGFFALSHEIWETLWTAETTNRLTFVIVYLVLLAGTGSDHRLTKWSARACEQYTGLGKPRAKQAIEELIEAGLVTRTDASTRMLPQYELPSLPLEVEPIFLPVALVTGLAGEASMLRRIRETGDALALRMLIDLYAAVSLDATHGIPIDMLHGGRIEGGTPTARKIAEVGAHAVWALTEGSWRHAGGDWTSLHRVNVSDTKSAWAPFWGRLDLLKQIGAIWFEAWVFDGDELDAEPLFPLDASGFYAVAKPTDEAELTRAAFEVSRALVGEERSYVFDHADANFYLPLTAHHRAPAYRQVARLRVEADTPGRRLAWKRRRTLIEQYQQAFAHLQQQVDEGTYGSPLRTTTAGAKA
jgi:hypothetical protein